MLDSGAVAGEPDADPSARRRLLRYSVEHTRLRVGDRPVVEVPDLEAWHLSPDAPPASRTHRNWLQRDDFTLPNDRFSRYLDTPEVNLLDVVESAACRLAPDGQVVVRPIGSLAYARTDRLLQWPVVRDLDLWVYVTTTTLTQGDWLDLHRQLQGHVWDVLQERRVLAHRSRRTGYVYLREFNGRTRMIELKLADVGWLHTGLHQAHRRCPKLLRTPIPAHFETPRLEWAGYTPYENYFPSHESESAFAAALRSITDPELDYGLHYTYAENLAEAYRVLTPQRLAQAAARPRMFFRYSRKIWKKTLMLAVMRGDEAAWSAAVQGLAHLQSGRDVAFAHSTRTDYLAALVLQLQRLRGDGIPAKVGRWSTSRHDGTIASRSSGEGASAERVDLSRGRRIPMPPTVDVSHALHSSR